MPNLGVHSTQRNKGYHPITKRNLYKNLPISKAIEVIVEDLEQLMSIHNRRVDDNRKSRPTLLDLEAFERVADYLTHYCLDKAATEWAATKQAGDRIETGKATEEEKAEFERLLPVTCFGGAKDAPAAIRLRIEN